MADGTVALCRQIVSRRMQRTAIGPHQLGHVGTCHLCVGKQFEGTHNGVVSHRSALHHNLVSEVIARMQFEHLVKAVLYDRVGDSCRDVGNACPLAQHLFHL